MSIAVTGALRLHAHIHRVLVVAPLSILGVWQEEFAKFADFPYTLTVLKGTLEKKRALLKTPTARNTMQVMVVNYESAWRLEKELLAYDADLIIADEGHKLKENRTSQSKGMHHLGAKARYKLLLTGTVITNREMDVFSQYKFLNPDIFGSSFYAFRNHFFDMTGYGQHTPVFRQSKTNEFLELLHSVTFRVTKAEALDLPDITEETRYVELEPKTMKLYKELARESFAELKDGKVSAVNILTKLLRFSQVTGGFVGDDDNQIHRVSTAKLDALSDIIDSAMADDKKLVIMARFVPEMDAITELLEKQHIRYAEVRGGVKDRAEEVSRFQNDSDCRVFVGQIAAAGLGLTLTAADTMVFYSLDYSMANFTQAQARIHRIGAKATCHYIYLIAKGTVDEKVMAALRGKVDLAKALVDDYRKGISPFTADED